MKFWASNLDLTLFVAFPDQENNDEVEFTGVGYFLTLKDPAFQKNRAISNKPDIRGQLGGVDVGCLAFVENHELTLECYSCEQEISSVNREQGFQCEKT